MLFNLRVKRDGANCVFVIVINHADQTEEEGRDSPLPSIFGLLLTRSRERGEREEEAVSRSPLFHLRFRENGAIHEGRRRQCSGREGTRGEGPRTIPSLTSKRDPSE